MDGDQTMQTQQTNSTTVRRKRRVKKRNVVTMTRLQKLCAEATTATSSYTAWEYIDNDSAAEVELSHNGVALEYEFTKREAAAFLQGVAFSRLVTRAAAHEALGDTKAERQVRLLAAANERLTEAVSKALDYLMSRPHSRELGSTEAQIIRDILNTQDKVHEAALASRQQINLAAGDQDHDR